MVLAARSTCPVKRICTTEGISETFARSGGWDWTIRTPSMIFSSSGRACAPQSTYTCAKEVVLVNKRKAKRRRREGNGIAMGMNVRFRTVYHNFRTGGAAHFLL